jgi:predicted transposase YbfD/YdcC
VPAPTSSPIPALAHRLDALVALAPGQCRSLLDDLAQINDPRQRRGRRHALAAVLAVAVAAVLSGARSLAAIGEWAADAPQPVLAALGVRRDPLRGAYRPPGEATVRRVLARVDPDVLDLVIGRWLADQQPAPTPWSGRQAVAVDGKTLRGTGRHGVGQVHLLAAMDHIDGTVLAQRQVDGAPSEVTGFHPLLAGLDLAGVVVTADALHTQREHAEFLITGKQADYVFLVKGLRTLAHRYQALSAELAVLDAELDRLTATAAPKLVALFGVGSDSAGALLVAAGDNPDRLRSDAAFSMLCGASPIQASSGKTRRHRLNRGGDRQANAALYRIVVARLRHDEKSQRYVARRISQGKSKKEAIRCLKRYVAREVFAVLPR